MPRHVPLSGKRFLLSARPMSCRTMPIRSSASPRSWMVKDSSRPIRPAYSRSSRAPMLWKVPDQGRLGSACVCGKPSAFCSTPATRRSISCAARRLKVSSIMRCGSAPWRIRLATRCASVLVLPEPAPAMTSRGRVSCAESPVPCNTAANCSALRSFKGDPSGFRDSAEPFVSITVRLINGSGNPSGCGGGERRVALIASWLRPRNIYQALGWLLACVMVPLLLGATALLVVEWRQERQLAEKQLSTLAQTLVQAVDGELNYGRAQLEVIAASPVIDAQDWRQLHRFGVEVVSRRPGTVIALLGPDGQGLLNTAMPWGQPRPNLWKLGEEQREVLWEG